MSGKRFDFEIKDEDNFDNADLFDRKDFAEALRSLCINSSDSLVVALDDQWGAGKTFFLRLWSRMLSEEGVPTVYFNAFENDFSGDAFVSLSAALVQELNATKPDKEFEEKFTKSAAKFGRIVGRSAINIALKAGTAGLVDAVDAGEAVDAAIEQAGNEASGHLENIISEKARFQDEKRQFRDALGDLREAMQAEETQHPLVFVIDELDRCRPSFALDILECLKHFFDTERTHFVLGVNIEALASSIEGIHGNRINGEKYLSRFIDYRIGFQVPQHVTYKEQLVSYGNRLWESEPVFSEHETVREGIVEILAHIVKARGGTPRDLNRIFSVLYLCLATITERTFRVPPILAGLIVMKYYDPSLFQKVSNNEASFEEVREFFGFRRMINNYNDNERELVWMHEWWGVLLGENLPDETKRMVRSGIVKYNFHRDNRVISTVARNIVDRYWQGHKPE